MSEHSPAQKRRYASPKREQAARETRHRIRAAGSELFLRDGYVATSMAAIARAAGVSERTVYLAYESKAALLNEIIRVGVRGDDRLEALTDREDVRAVQAASSGAAVIAGFARGTAGVLDRAARFLALGEAAATVDAAVAVARDRGHAGQRHDVRAVAERLRALGALRPGLDVDRATDILVALGVSESVYLRFTEECGWSPAEYAEVIERVLAAAVLSEPGHNRP